MPSTLPDHMARAEKLLGSARAESSTAEFNPYAISMVQLCYFSYDPDPTDIASDIQDPAKVFPPQSDTYWECMWGPVLDEAGGNLVYIAGLLLDSSEGPENSPFLVAVVTRGTDATGVWADFQQLYEDMTPVPQENPSWNDNAQEWVASGSLDALANIQGLTYNNQSILEYLNALPSHDGYEPYILITGHSLGGCASTLIAPWLASSLPQSKTSWIVPFTFAAPTAGNSAFVSDLQNCCPLGQYYYNTLDCIPLAWWNLDHIDGIYAPKYPTPLAVEGWVSSTNLALWDDTYNQVPNGYVPQLTGTVIRLKDPTYGLEFMEEVAAQHACANYMLLMGLTPPYAFSAGASRMQRLDPGQALPVGS